MKTVGVVNRINLINFGSVLQVYALCEVIRQFGFYAEVVWEKGNLSKNFDIRPNKIFNTILKLLLHPSLLRTTIKTVLYVKNKKTAQEKVDKFNSFATKNFKQSLYTNGDLKKIAKTDKYFKFVCGSDQVWSSTTLYVDPLMYLRFAPIEKRVAYAPSLGRDYIPDYNKWKMRKYITEIPHLSVREYSGQRLIAELTGVVVPVVLDPTLLLSKEQWNLLKASSKDENYVVCYFLDTPSAAIINRIDEICQIENKRIVNIGVPLEVETHVLMINEHIGPDEFLGVIDEADMIFTDSYHGMLFSITYNKPFWSIARNYGEFDQSSRQKTVLSMLGLDERYVEKPEEILCSSIDYTKANQIIREQRELSINYLKKSLLE